jgi:hypothetical protein
MSGLEFWIWAVVYVGAFIATVFLVAAWFDHDDDLAPYRFPYRDDDQDGDQ